MRPIYMAFCTSVLFGSCLLILNAYTVFDVHFHPGNYSGVADAHREEGFLKKLEEQHQKGLRRHELARRYALQRETRAEHLPSRSMEGMPLSRKQGA